MYANTPQEITGQLVLLDSFKSYLMILLVQLQVKSKIVQGFVHEICLLPRYLRHPDLGKRVITNLNE